MSVSSRLRTAVAVLTVAAVAAPAAALAATTPKLPAISSFSPVAAATTAKILVLGKNFTHVKAVTVDGMTAKYKVDSAGKLTVTIPAKAKSGKIAVTTSAGTVKSAHALKIKA